MCRPPKGSGIFTVLGIFILLFLIFYQVIITLIIPIRFNLFVLFIEVILLIFLIYRVIWPY